MDQLLSKDEITLVNDVRRLMHELEDRCDRAALGSTYATWEVMQLGVLKQCADKAGDALFDVFNQARNALDQKITDDQIHREHRQPKQ